LRNPAVYVTDFSLPIPLQSDYPASRADRFRLFSSATVKAAFEGETERIQREIEEYTALSKQATQLTQIIHESMGKIRASVTH
jgi:hypothetical protein